MMPTLKVIKYQPELNEMTGSITATIVMGQLEYWFEKTGGKPFYKFLLPCEDECYKDGDSWCEELGFSKNEFRTAFGHIGKVYKSKRAYVESKDKFAGKMYLSYYDRIRRRTYYMRNQELMECMGYDLCRSEKEAPTNLESDYPITEDYTRELHTKNTTEDDTEKGQCVHEQVISLYHDICEGLPKVAVVTKRRQELIDQFIMSCEGGIGQVKALFEKVKASDFLSGRTPKGTWRAQFDWIMKKENGQAILSGKYDTWKREEAPSEMTAQTVVVPRFEGMQEEREYPAMPYVKGKNRFTTTYTHNWDMDELEALAYEHFQSL
ncbi:MAG: hypothetical protein ACRCW2_06730 [Cellulosilyticaceae bacterium]